MASIKKGWVDFERLASMPEAYVAELCRIDLADIMGTLEMHSALYGYAVATHELAKVAEVQARAEADRMKAQTFLDIAARDPSLPVNRLERMVEVDATYQTLLARYHAALRQAGILKALVAGLDHRRDMLIQIASRQRRELDA